MSAEIGGRWKNISRRNPTHRIFLDTQAEKSDDQTRARQARAFALSKLIPLRTAKRTFPSLPALAKAIGLETGRLAYWREHYPSAAHIIKKLLAPSS